MGEFPLTEPGPRGAVRRMSEATARYVPYSRPPAGAPNVVMIVLDDIGFAQLGCFGSAVATPSIDRLAAAGLRYNRFHVTSICSSTRAALLSGRNHHAVGIGMTMETPLGFPGYTGRIPKSAALIPRILRDSGYSTMAVGKWHLCPRGEYSASGPMDRWPLGQGFERFYGFLSAETSQWDPPLVQDNCLVDAPRSPDEGYHLSEDLADRAIRMVLDQRQATPDKPFFCYLATGAAHAPHQVPPAWIEPYRGAFDHGWEAERAATFARQLAAGVVPAGTELTARPDWVPDWRSLSADERRLFARYMEVFAGFVTHADAQIGRFLDFLDARGDLDNTLVLVLSDNGASAEGSQVGTINEPHAWLGQAEGVTEALRHIDELGGHRSFGHYPWGWAWAGNTPLQLWKRYAWLGGVRTPLVVHWPGHLAGPGQVRSQFCHAVDLFATVLDAAGVSAPEVVDGVPQLAVEGASIAVTFTDAGAASPRRTQYFEMHGSRGIYHDGWKATTDYVSPLFGERQYLTGSQDFDDDHWALFNLDEDFAEARDLAGAEPGRMAALRDLWWAEAGRNQVLPLWEGPKSRTGIHPGEYPAPVQASYVPGGGGICEAQLPPMAGGFTATADIEIGDVEVGGDPAAAEGVICALGDLNGGWALYLVAGRPVSCLISFGQATRIAGPGLTAGRHEVTVSFEPSFTGPARLCLRVDGELVAEAGHGQPAMFPGLATAGARMLVGRDTGLPFNDDYRPPFPFTGVLRRVLLRSSQPADPRTTAERVEQGVHGD
jgi:arylsulfatase A-like enzyme